MFWGNYRAQGTQRTRVGTDMPLYTCLGTVCSQHMAVCQLSSAQDKGQVEELRAIRSHLCPQPELTESARFVVGEAPPLGTPVTCWTFLRLPLFGPRSDTRDKTLWPLQAVPHPCSRPCSPRVLHACPGW